MTYHAPSSSTAVALTSLADAGALQAADADIVNRAGTDYKTTQQARATLIRATPAASRSAALPATVSASDNDKTVFLSGTTGNLSVSGTLPDGFKCHVINNASGAATYSGITGLASQTSLTAGHCTTIAVVGSTVYALAY